VKFVDDNSTTQPNHFLKCYTLLHSVRPIKVLHKIKRVVIVLWSHNLLWELSLTTLVYFYISCFVNIPRVPNAILSNFKSISFIYDDNVKQVNPLLMSFKSAKLDKIPLSITKICSAIFTAILEYIFFTAYSKGGFPLQEKR
jgi:hypothetical protein